MLDAIRLEADMVAAEVRAFERRYSWDGTRNDSMSGNTWKAKTAAPRPSRSSDSVATIQIQGPAGASASASGNAGHVSSGMPSSSWDAAYEAATLLDHEAGWAEVLEKRPGGPVPAWGLRLGHALTLTWVPGKVSITRVRPVSEERASDILHVSGRTLYDAGVRMLRKAPLEAWLRGLPPAPDGRTYAELDASRGFELPVEVRDHLLGRLRPFFHVIPARFAPQKVWRSK
jgi:hypothetical protein